MGYSFLSKVGRVGGGGWGPVLPYKSYIGMYGAKGYFFRLFGLQ